MADENQVGNNRRLVNLTVLKQIYTKKNNKQPPTLTNKSKQLVAN